eukprot:13867354-Ditylum_brightwellii.AAC.1
MFSMTIPSDAYHQYAGRCALLKGPSGPFFYRKDKLFMRLAGNAIDGATKKALRQDNIRMNEDVVRQVAYHLFIWL